MYFLLLVDDFTYLVLILKLKGKIEAFNAFKKFRILVEKESKEKLKCFIWTGVDNLTRKNS